MLQSQCSTARFDLFHLTTSTKASPSQTADIKVPPQRMYCMYVVTLKFLCNATGNTGTVVTLNSPLIPFSAAYQSINQTP